MVLPLFKKIFENKNFLLVDGESIGVDFLAIVGLKNPYKVSTWTEKCIIGFNLVSDKDFVDIQEDLFDNGIYEKMDKIYSNYNLFNTGVAIYFKTSGEVKFLSFDRIKEFINNSVNLIDKKYIFDLEFYTNDSAHRHYCIETSRSDINVTSDFINTFIDEEKRKYRNRKSGKVGKSNKDR